ncbi:MAG: sigma factor, partial [Oscillospiraceae bacterium]|nr:sigma factor [Oscillospiraceae bacterium]
MLTEEMQKQAQQLLQVYYSAPTVNLRNDLVMLYSYIPKTVAAQMRGVTSSYAQLEDIVNQGVITLIDCIEKFDPTKGVKFESYAFMRVKCANIDFIRKQDWLPRRVRKTAKDVTLAHDELSNKLMREP